MYIAQVLTLFSMSFLNGVMGTKAGNKLHTQIDQFQESLIKMMIYNDVKRVKEAIKDNAGLAKVESHWYPLALN